ncbi:MAG: aminoacyltransferase [Erysipelotrichaceae bacterium]|nr:aminoacyltransferase [Erysipelotrichaceae bacterium]
MEYQFIEQVNEEDHDTFIKAHPLCSLLQSSKWAKVKQNWDSIRSGVKNEYGELVLCSLILIKRLPLNFSFFYIPRGPIADFQNKELLAFYFEHVKKLSKRYRCLLIKVDPGLHVNDYLSSDYNTNHYPETKEYLEVMKVCGAIHQGFVMSIGDSIQPRFQANVYRAENFEETLPRHTRRLIKDALKRKVEVVIGGKEYVSTFAKLVALTEERKGVSLRSEQYFQSLCDIYGSRANIMLARVNLSSLCQEYMQKYEEIEKEIASCEPHAKKKIRRLEDMRAALQKDIKEFQTILEQVNGKEGWIFIAGVLSIRYGHTCEMLYAGMDQRFKKFMPQYYLYQENMKWAFENGCESCNMGGIEGSLQDGLTKFKDNFRPIINEFIGEFDIPTNKLLYPFVKIAYKYMKRRLM